MSQAGTGTQRGPITVTVKITPGMRGSPPTVSPDPVTISKSRGDGVEWECVGNKDFVVCYGDDTPFSSHHFYQGNSHSGPIGNNVPPGRYKYCVEVEGAIADPNTIVDP